MKTKLLFCLLFSCFLFACKTPAYLPDVNSIDQNVYGCHIKLIHRTHAIFEGELIAIDKDQVYVLTPTVYKCVSLPIKEIKRYRLTFARPKHYEWTIPLGLINLPMHGLYSVFTLPIHLIITSLVTISGYHDFTYTNLEYKISELSYFARFPNGFPPGIGPSDIN